jgi:hypothetical protein
VLKRSDIPPWTGNDERMQAFVNAELDKRDADFDRKMAEDAANLVHMLAMRTPEAADFLRKVGLSPFPRSKAERRKRRLTIGKRADADWRKMRDRRAVEEGDIEALRQLHPGLARFLNLPPRRGRPKKIGRDPWSRQNRLADAILELPRIRALWKAHYGRSNRPKGAITAEKIAAERWGLTEDDVKKRWASRSRRQ